MPHDQPVVAIETGDGHRFELVRAGAAEPGSAMLFVPGMGVSARHYIGFARALAGRGIEVFVHEWRGNGSSSLRAGRRVDWGYRELLEQDLAAAIAAVRTATGRERIVLGGHSLGAQFACLSGALAPQCCAGLVVVAGGAPYWRTFPLPMKLLLPLATATMPVVGRLVGYYPGKRLGFAGNEARGVVSDWARTVRTGQYRVPSIGTDLEAGLGELRVPALALRMADDWFVPQASLDWLTAKLVQSRLDGAVLDAAAIGASAIDQRADHYAWMSAPDAAADRIGQWAGTQLGQ